MVKRRSNAYGIMGNLHNLYIYEETIYDEQIYTGFITWFSNKGLKHILFPNKQ